MIKQISTFSLFFLFINCYAFLFAQKDSIIETDDLGRPEVILTYKRGKKVQKKIHYTQKFIFLDKHTYIDTPLIVHQYKFLSGHKSLPIGAIDTLKEEIWAGAYTCTTLMRQDSFTFVEKSSTNSTTTQSLPNDWEYIKIENSTFTKTGYYHHNQPDSIWTYSDIKIGERQHCIFYGQEAKKWAFSNYQEDTLLSTTIVDDNIPFWSYTSFYGNGKKQREIIAQKDSIPLLTEWNLQGRKIKSYQTWEYNMLGKAIIEKPTEKWLRIFPNYTGLYIKHFPKQKKLLEEEEWGFGNEFGDESIKESPTTRKKNKRPSQRYLELYWFHKGNVHNKSILIRKNGRIEKDEYAESDWRHLTENLVVIKNNKPFKKHTILQKVPFIPLKEDEDENDYKLGKGFGHDDLWNFNCYSEEERLKWNLLHTIRYELRAKQAMGIPIHMMLKGHIIGWNDPNTYRALMEINYNIEVQFTNCTGNQTPLSWISHIKKINLDSLKIQALDCGRTYNIDNIYNCYTKKMQTFIQEKWAKEVEKDTSLSPNYFIPVRLHYRENKLTRIEWPKNMHKEAKSKRILKRILFEMPSYIIPKKEGKRKISFNYVILIH